MMELNMTFGKTKKWLGWTEGSKADTVFPVGTINIFWDSNQRKHFKSRNFHSRSGNNHQKYYN